MARVIRAHGVQDVGRGDVVDESGRGRCRRDRCDRVRCRIEGHGRAVSPVVLLAHLDGQFGLWAALANLLQETERGA